MDLRKHIDSIISIKKLSKADLGTSDTSNQTHIGLFDGTFNFVDIEKHTFKSKIIFENEVIELLSLLDFIHNPDGSLRSPKIRKGNDGELFLENVKYNSVVRYIREVTNESDYKGDWYLLWFGLESSEIIFYLFNQDQIDFRSLEDIAGKIGGRKKIDNTQQSESLLEFINKKIEPNNMERNAKDNLNKNKSTQEVKVVEKKVNVDFELDLFIQNLFNEVQALVYSDDDGDTKENKFTEHLLEILSDAEETEGTRLCNYVKENKNENIQFKINGYALEDGYENVDIFISKYKDVNEIYRVSKPEFDKLIKWSTGFVNAALKGYLDEIEPSHEAYGLAEVLKKQFKNIIRVNIFILSNGEIPHDPPTNLNLKGLDDILINFNIWDVERLYRLSISNNNREPIEIDFEELLNEVIPCLEMPSSNELYECYLAIVPGSILANLYRNYGTRLLESNVRAFLQQNGKVNKAIRDTIRWEPYMFLPYNNGLAATANNVGIRLNDKGQQVITSVKDFQIVNGGQTTASLFHTAKKYKEADLKDVFVQMKLTVIRDVEKKDVIVPNISRYANSQNKVSELDLSSNNPFLQRLEELSRTNFVVDINNKNKQTIWFFERVKGQYKEALNKEPTKGKKDAFKLKHPRNQFIIKSDVSKYMNLWNLQPNLVSKGAQKSYISFIEDIDKGFKKENYGKIYWQDLVSNAILFKSTDKLFGRKNHNPIGDTNIKSYTVSYSLSYFHKLTNNKIDLLEIWRNQEIQDDLLIELKKLLVFVFDFFKKLDVALISEAAKSKKTWEKLQENVNHPMDMEVVSKYLINDVDFKKRYESEEDNVEETNRYNNLSKINSLGIKFWDGLSIYNGKENIISKVKMNFAGIILKKIKDQKAFSDIEIKHGIEIIETINDQKIEISKIVALSNIKDVEIVDPSRIYNRLKLISGEKWKKIIDLGEQTKKLSYKELSVIKTVINKLKKKENIDLNRLKVVDESLEKVRNFINV